MPTTCTAGRCGSWPAPPRGCRSWCRAGRRRTSRGWVSGRVVEVGPGDALEVAGVALTVTDALHHGGRTKRDRGSTETVGYVLERAGRRLYFAGDTDLFDAMADLDRIDLAAIPISGWWRGSGPATSTRRAPPRRSPGSTRRRVLPIHWGTYSPEDLRPAASRAGPWPTGVASPRSSPGGGWRTAWCGSTRSDRALVGQRGRPLARQPPGPCGWATRTRRCGAFHSGRGGCRCLVLDRPEPGARRTPPPARRPPRRSRRR